jgi:hypothetical protein
MTAMRVLIVSSEPGDVATASGTAVAVRALRHALASGGTSTAVLRPWRRAGGHTVTRLRFNRSLSASTLRRYDVVLGVNGDGCESARRAGVPSIALLKALYAGAAEHERGATRLLLATHARWERDGARAFRHRRVALAIAAA